MADLPSWLRFGKGPKTPAISGPPMPSEEREQLFSSTNASTSPVSPPRRSRPTGMRRVTSLLNIGDHGRQVSTSAPASSMPSSLKSNASGSSLSRHQPAADVETQTDFAAEVIATSVPKDKDAMFERAATEIWHNPNLEQMIEALQVVMIQKRDGIASIPVQFNGHVLALLEGYRKLSNEVRDTKKLREQELESFRAMSEEWLGKEQGYRAEIKRLEVILSLHSQEGVGAVLMARAGSVIDRGAGAKERFAERIKRLSTGKGDEGVAIKDATDNGKSAEMKATRMSSVYAIDSLPRLTDPDQDRLVSEQLGPAATRASRDKSTQHQLPSKGRQPAHQQGDGPQSSQEGQQTYVPTGARYNLHVEAPPSAPRHQDDLALPPRRVDSSPSTSSSSSDDEVTNLPTRRRVRRGDTFVSAPDRSRARLHGEPMVRNSRRAGQRTLGELNAWLNETVLGYAPAADSSSSSSHLGKFLDSNPSHAGMEVLDFGSSSPAAPGPRAVKEDYLSHDGTVVHRKPAAQHKPAALTSRPRGFSFNPGEEDVLPFDSMAMVPVKNPAKDKGKGRMPLGITAPDNETEGDISQPELLQPTPLSAVGDPSRLSFAGQLQESIATEPADVGEAAPPLRSGGVAIPGINTASRPTSTSSRPDSTGSAIYNDSNVFHESQDMFRGCQNITHGQNFRKYQNIITGDHHSITIRSQSSTSSRNTVLRVSERHSSRNRAHSQGSDLGFQSSDNCSDDVESPPPMSSIPEGLRTSTSVMTSPSPSARKGRVSSKKGGKGMKSATPSPALTPLRRPTTPLERTASPMSSRRTAARTPSRVGSTEPGGGPHSAARIAAQLAFGRGQKRMGSENLSRRSGSGSGTG